MARPAHSWTTLFVFLASIVEKADEQVLPAVYLFVGRSLGATPSQLGTLTFCRAIVQAISSPVSGVIGDKYDRTKVIAAGCLLWGVMTSAIAMADSVHEAMVYAGLNGVGLALVIPCCQSIIANSYPAEKRGRAFGFMQSIGYIGVLVGGLFATNVGHTTPFGMDGWRFALHCVAIMSILTGVLVYLFAKDPQIYQNAQSQVGTPGEHSLLDDNRTPLIGGHKSSNRGPYSGKKGSSNFFSSFFQAGAVGKTLSEIRHVLSIRSFQVIILQGVVGSLPWTALVFLTLWLQLLGFSDFAASTLMSCFHMGTVVGGALGGFIGDRMSVLFPNNGRIYTAQFSVIMGIPFSFVLLQLLPSAKMKGAYLVYGLVMFLMSASISWCGAGCNSPIFADIVPENLYSKIFAFDRSFEGAIAATAAPMVGIISETFFGFKGDAATGRGEDSENAASLGNSLFVCLVVPWLLCFVFYFGLHFSYQHDRNAVRRKAQREALV